MTRLILVAVLTALLSGCAARFDSYDRGACLVILPDGASALRYAGEMECDI